MDNYRPQTGAASGGMKARYIAIFLLAAFICGGILTVWAAQRFELFGTTEKAADAPATKPEVAAEPAFSSLPAPIAPAKNAAMDQQVDNLEARLSRINADAQAASGNAARAEAMLLAFAARRAIDSGAALGYIEPQLQSRFGATQPKEVAAIVQATRTPVTLDILRAELASQGDSWLAQDGLTTWGRIQKEMSELFVLRKDTTPSPAPTRRLERARQYTEMGNMEAAIKEVEKLPGAREASGWLEKARRYVNVRKALDSIERSALAQPADLIAPKSAAPAPPVPAAPAAGETGEEKADNIPAP
ncbi:hypothetical protein ACFOWX_12775 [Sphingorhabdus arenilitoris]|uniref:Inner membrane protein n=1 Tax=Sphingorhabdus arenilitoris TaxID=1490041 RepID=A0ABV8RLD1_9SPHN